MAESPPQERGEPCTQHCEKRLRDCLTRRGSRGAASRCRMARRTRFAEDGVVIAGELDGAQKRVDPRMTKGKDVEKVLIEERMRESRLTLYDVAVMRFGFGDTEDPRTFTALLDSFGVPKRGSRLALPEGMPMEVDWPSLLRH